MAFTVNKVISKFTDLNMLFSRHPITNDVTVKKDEEAVKFAIKNLLLTRHYEKPFHPEIGTNLFDLLFENYSITTKAIIEQEVRLVIENYEPRASVVTIDIKADPPNNTFMMEVTFLLNNSTEPVVLPILLERTR